jgi:Domain of unknown function (DUF4276)
MTRLHLVVEGDTEELFVIQTLAPYLAARGVYCGKPIVLWTKRNPAGGGYRGGVSTWQNLRNNLIPKLRDSNAWVTTLIDFYQLPKDTPGLAESASLNNAKLQVTAIQNAISAELAIFSNLIPFITLHEFEALLFASPQKIAEHFGRPNSALSLTNAVQTSGGAELINHGIHTHPAARLENLFKPNYQKKLDGAAIANKIGIETMLEQCPHFAAWVRQLCALGQAAN